MIQIDDALISDLADKAAVSPRRRQHHNLHSSYGDPAQRLLNFLWFDSYIAPHRHSLDPKEETLIALRGAFGCVRFDDKGAIVATCRLECGGPVSGIVLAPGDWHTLVALTPTALLLEVKAGPFDPEAAKEPALWAPREQSADAAPYLRELQARFA
jgi:cupin fold WbuC family metalloprotein